MSTQSTKGIRVKPETHAALERLKRDTKWQHQDLMEKAIMDLCEKVDREGPEYLYKKKESDKKKEVGDDPGHCPLPASKRGTGTSQSILSTACHRR